MVAYNDKWSVQVETAVNKASWVLERIRKSFLGFFTLIYVRNYTQHS